MKKLKQKTKVYSISGATDKKSKLNKLNKIVDRFYLEQIEDGVTIEQIDKMKSKGLPVLKYGTQITIHGLFPNLSNNYIYGYKNVFQNKNKSIGIKYNAIDEDKRRVIADKVKQVGWKYSRNSSDFNFEKVLVRDSKDKVPDAINELKQIMDNIDESLFYGGKQIYYGEIFGRWYIVLSVRIGAIYEVNVDKVSEQMGATKDAINQAVKQREVKEKERQERWDKEKQESELKKKLEKEKHKADLDHLESSFEKVSKQQSEGTYIKVGFNWKDEICFTKVKIYKVKGKQKPRWISRDFDSLNEALNTELESSFSDRIFKGKVSGYLIKET